jgi:hypothetical protein
LAHAIATTFDAHTIGRAPGGSPKLALDIRGLSQQTSTRNAVQESAALKRSAGLLSPKELAREVSA